MQGIRIGDCVLVTSPTEVCVQVGLNVKARRHTGHLVSGFSNGYIHYGPPAADYAMGGYEVTECLLAPEWQEMFEKATADVITRL